MSLRQGCFSNVLRTERHRQSYGTSGKRIKMRVAFIPVRGGSKSIPLKNIKIMNGKPLVYWTVKAAAECAEIDKVYVATDSGKIRDTVAAFGMEKVEVITRSAESASDTASTEFAMLEFAEKYDFESIVLVQATSPLLTSEDLSRGCKLFEKPDVDSVLSVVRQKRFHWEEDTDGYAHATNYDVFHRPRRQEFEGYLVENGAFYITSKKLLMESKNRISGNIKVCEMCEDSFIEIDEPQDWTILETLMKKRRKAAAAKKKIRLVATDCDGVLTDGGMYYSESGDEVKKFNTLDGMGFELLRGQGIKTAIITGETNRMVERRANKLKADDLIMGQKDKLEALEKLCAKYGISMDEAAYIGDDVFDIPAIEACGFGCAPQNALDEVKAKADYTTKAAGGKGCFREMVNVILENNERILN